MSERTQIKLSSGQVIDVWTIKGVVADDRHSSQTSVYSTGGGGYVGEHGGYIAAPEVHSQTTTRQNIWITDAKGKDHEVSFTNTRLPLRVGQRVTARYVGDPGAGEWRLVTFTNHSSDLFYSWAEQQDAPLNLLATDRGQISASVLVIGGAGAGWIASQVHTVISWPWVTWLSVVSIPFAGLAMFYGFMMRMTRRSRLRDGLRAEYIGAVNALQ